ncbi:hypothetical protein BSPWISOXPB_4181 [uncultured Gammaproteobacteria bacterium]|nr:hypothetical protein BSPWISOXPB_4181 [uncultured Gammaproteobacteria bacterium]
MKFIFPGLSIWLFSCSFYNILDYNPKFNFPFVGLGWIGDYFFLLVVYYQNNKSLGAGMVTVLTNRVGDAILLCVIGVFCREGG